MACQGNLYNPLYLCTLPPTAVHDSTLLRLMLLRIYRIFFDNATLLRNRKQKAA